jgi:hypothetical protein
MGWRLCLDKNLVEQIRVALHDYRSMLEARVDELTHLHNIVLESLEEVEEAAGFGPEHDDDDDEPTPTDDGGGAKLLKFPRKAKR